MSGGIAYRDGRLMPGDQILSVNNEDTRNATQEFAAQILKVGLVLSLYYLSPPTLCISFFVNSSETYLS